MSRTGRDYPLLLAPYPNIRAKKRRPAAVAGSYSEAVHAKRDRAVPHKARIGTGRESMPGGHGWNRCLVVAGRPTMTSPTAVEACLRSKHGPSVVFTRYFFPITYFLYTRPGADATLNAVSLPTASSQETASMKTTEEVFRLPSGQSIKEMRAARGWSQEQLARRSGVSLSTVQRWEKSSAPPSRLARRELERLVGRHGGRKGTRE